MTLYICAGCDAETDSPTLPAGWSETPSSIGTLDRCPSCTHKVAPKILCQRLASADQEAPPPNDPITGAAQGRLRTIIERIERLEEDKAVISEDMKEVYAEAKGEGFDVKILRKVVRLRKLDKVKRSEEQDLIDLYLSAVEG